MIQSKLTQKVIIAAIILLLIFLSYKFLGKIKNDFVNSKQRAKQKKDLQNLLDSHEQDNGGQVINNVETFKKAEFDLMASALFRAMEGIGTDETTIFAILSRLRTKADWFALVASYGVKKAAWGSFKGNLVEWLTDELGGSDKTRINNLLGKFNVQI